MHGGIQTRAKPSRQHLQHTTTHIFFLPPRPYNSNPALSDRRDFQGTAPLSTPGRISSRLSLAVLPRHVDGIRLRPLPVLLRLRGRVAAAALHVVPVPVLVVDEDGSVALAVAARGSGSPGAAALLERLQPWELGEGGGPEAHVAVGAVGREGMPGRVLDEAVEGEAVGEAAEGEGEVDEAEGRGLLVWQVLMDWSVSTREDLQVDE